MHAHNKLQKDINRLQYAGSPSQHYLYIDQHAAPACYVYAAVAIQNVNFQALNF